MIAVVYSDASYCKKSDIAACGFVVIFNGIIVKHEVQLVQGLKKPTNAEIYALVAGLQYSFLINGVKSILANTDCESLVTRRKRKAQYSELDTTLEIINDYEIGVVINFVKGHSGNYYNNMVDRSCITQLRKYLKNCKNDKKSIHQES